MESNKKYVIGLDFGTDSCRALVVDTYTGCEMATGVSFYPRWKAGLYCDAHNNRYRQHPLDYIESMTEAVHIALSDLKEEEIASICGLCFDTTGSTPALTDKAGMPLALCPEFAEEPDAMFILWKDHTAVREAEQINALINKRNLDYLLYEGGTYSSEWVWSKVLHIINTNVAIKDAAYAWVEHCDWMTGLVTGNTIPEQIFRSRCAAGHKAMWHASWGLPSGEVLEELNPALKEMLPHLFTETHTSDTKAGELTPEGEARQKVLDGMLVELTREAQDMEPSEDGVVALDWMNGRRTPDADQNVKGAVAGLTLGTSAPEMFRALVEATAFGSRRIVEHMKGQGLRIDSVNAIGGISKKAPFVMQTLADVLDMPIRVVRSEQTCALGAAMFAAVAAGVYKDINEATRHMGSDIEAEYRPDEKRALIYEKLYKKYLELAKLAETIN